MPTIPNLDHPVISEYVFGPGNDLVLRVEQPIWTDSRGKYGAPPLTFWFRMIQNLAEVTQYFTPGPSRHLFPNRLELSSIHYDLEHKSKPLNLYVRLTCERIDYSLLIHCARLTIEPSQPISIDRV